MPTPTLTESIRQAAAEPHQAAGETGSLEVHSLPDQIAADRYLRSTEAARRPKLPCRLCKAIPPGSV